jgi:hypothetical protein
MTRRASFCGPDSASRAHTKFVPTLDEDVQIEYCKLATVAELPAKYLLCQSGDVGKAFYLILHGMGFHSSTFRINLSRI